MVDNVSSNKCSSASDLVSELHAHNQQVFEEIEISTPELELELNDVKNSNQVETSLQLQPSANDKQNMISTEHGENDINSKNHILKDKTSSSSYSSKTASAFNSPNSSHNSTARPKNISSSSVTSRSSTSHRSYRKRRSSRASSSSSSSDREKFYNR